jgi:DNA-binding transcriptional MerR regulator/mannose-6-phosphate isomerase-like protein (cupin superfamily)
VHGAKARFSIGEVSRAIGVAPQTLRLWESKRLIEPQRTEGGRRIYLEEDVEHLRQIKRLRTIEGLNFAAIRQKLRSSAVPDTSNLNGRQDVAPTTLGVRLRRLRLEARKTLKEVSRDTGLSVSFISTLERGGSGASVASLRHLAEAYGTSVREIYGADIQQGSPLVRREERPVMKWDNGVRIEELVQRDTVMDPSWFHVPPQAGSGGFYSHTGEEFFLVIEGVLFVELKGQKTFKLRPGDTLYFPSTTPHRWWTEDETAEVVAVNTPPTF